MLFGCRSRNLSWRVDLAGQAVFGGVGASARVSRAPSRLNAASPPD